MHEPESEHICEFCGHRAYWQCGECQTTQGAIWINTSKLHSLESSHAELLETLKSIEAMLFFHEGSEEKLSADSNPVVVINAQGSDGDFQMMISEARQAIKNAEEKQ